MWNRKGRGSRQDPLHETTDGNQGRHWGTAAALSEPLNIHPLLPPKAPCSHYTTGLLSSFKPQLRYRLLSATQGIISNRSLLRSTLRASCTFITLCNNRLPHLDISTSSLDQKFQEGKDLVSACLVQREHTAMLSGPRGSAALDRKLLGPEREKNMVNYWQLTGGLVSDVLLHSRILTYCQKMSFSG